MFSISLRHRFGRLFVTAAVLGTILLVQAPRAHAADPSLGGNATCDGWSVHTSDFAVGGLLLNFITIKVDGVAVVSGQSFGTGSSWSGGYSQSLDIHTVEVVVIKTGGEVLATLSRSAGQCLDSIEFSFEADCVSWSVSVSGYPVETSLWVGAVAIGPVLPSESFSGSIERSGSTPSEGEFTLSATLAGTSTTTGRGRHVALDCPPTPTTTTTATTSTTTPTTSTPNPTTTTSAGGSAASAVAGGGTTTTTEVTGQDDSVVEEVAAESTNADDGNDATPDTDAQSTSTTEATSGSGGEGSDDDSEAVVAVPVPLGAPPQPAGTNPIVLALAAIGLLAIGGGGTALFFMNRGR